MPYQLSMHCSRPGLGIAFKPVSVQPRLCRKILDGCGTPGGTNYFPSGNSMFNPDYKSPRSVQMNIGIQREIRRGMVLSVDYARNVQTHYLSVSTKTTPVTSVTST